MKTFSSRAALAEHHASISALVVKEPKTPNQLHAMHATRILHLPKPGATFGFSIMHRGKGRKALKRATRAKYGRDALPNEIWKNNSLMGTPSHLVKKPRLP